MRRFIALMTVVIPFIVDAQLKVWVSYNDEEFAVFKQLVTAFEESTGIEVNVQRIPFEGQEQKILTACATRTAPDLARVDLSLIHI